MTIAEVITNLKKKNLERWANAKLTRGPEFAPVAKRLVSAKSRYQIVEAKTGVPWYVIAVIHERESSQKWNASLAQGDPWNRVSVHVPAGRGPFKSWEETAMDALTNCAPYAARNKDWTIGGLLTMLEQYNGLGYARKGIPSPYIWSGTNQYQSGKYVSDGVFSATAVDKQLGCAGLLLEMQKLDPSIKLGQSSIAQGGAAGAVIAAGAVASTQVGSWLHVAYIASGTILGALAVYLIVKWYKNKTQTTPIKKTKKVK